MFKKPSLVTVFWMLPLVACAAEPSVSELAWMAGCWASDGRETGTGEIWMAPAGGMMLGMNRSVREGEASGYEFIRISEESDGKVVFVASPSGQSTATFTMIKLDDNEVIFENPEHDFPQRIIYRRIGDTQLLGRIEGSVNGETRGVDFPMTKISCD